MIVVSSAGARQTAYSVSLYAFLRHRQCLLPSRQVTQAYWISAHGSACTQRLLTCNDEEVLFGLTVGYRISFIQFRDVSSSGQFTSLSVIRLSRQLEVRLTVAECKSIQYHNKWNSIPMKECCFTNAVNSSKVPRRYIIRDLTYGCDFCDLRRQRGRFRI